MQIGFVGTGEIFSAESIENGPNAATWRHGK
jgi:hypothetical protein